MKSCPHKFTQFDTRVDTKNLFGIKTVHFKCRYAWWYQLFKCTFYALYVVISSVWGKGKRRMEEIETTKAHLSFFGHTMCCLCHVIVLCGLYSLWDSDGEGCAVEWIIFGQWFLMSTMCYLLADVLCTAGNVYVTAGLFAVAVLLRRGWGSEYGCFLWNMASFSKGPFLRYYAVLSALGRNPSPCGTWPEETS